MFSEKAMSEAMLTVTSNYKDTVAERDQYRQWWLDEQKKTADLNITISAQHDEIVKLNEELNNLRETGTIIVHDRVIKEDQDANLHPEI